MTERSVITWGIAKPNQFEARFDGAYVHIDGELRDSRGPVLRCAGDVVEYCAGLQIEVGALYEETARDWTDGAHIKR